MSPQDRAPPRLRQLFLPDQRLTLNYDSTAT
jgi:hypothetical protein